MSDLQLELEATVSRLAEADTIWHDIMRADPKARGSQAAMVATRNLAREICGFGPDVHFAPDPAKVLGKLGLSPES